MTDQTLETGTVLKSQMKEIRGLMDLLAMGDLTVITIQHGSIRQDLYLPLNGDAEWKNEVQTRVSSKLAETLNDLMQELKREFESL